MLNKIKSKDFLRKFCKFINDGSRLAIAGKTRNIWSLFFKKDKNDYKSCARYKGDCSCDSRYISENKHNAEVRWNEHNNPTKSSEPLKHLLNNNDHCFIWTSISIASKNAKARKNLENFEKLVSFTNAVT